MKGDPPLATFAGKIEKYDVKATLARCDRDMSARQTAETKRRAMNDLFSTVRSIEGDKKRGVKRTGPGCKFARP